MPHMQRFSDLMQRGSQEKIRNEMCMYVSNRSSSLYSVKNHIDSLDANPPDLQVLSY